VIKKMIYMKKLFLYLFIIGLVSGSCDKDFVEVNTNPYAATAVDPAYLLANSQYLAALYNFQYQLPIIQQVLTPFGSTLEGGHHNIWYEPAEASSVWSDLYPGSVKLLTDIVPRLQNDTARSNLYNMARIWKAYCFMILVDTYCDVPYFNSGKGTTDGIFLPAYDEDAVIYDDILKELSEAVAGFKSYQPDEKNDLFYAGNKAQWKKLGNSLLLRAAMRYSKNNPTKAQQYVAIATNPANGGLMSSVADNARIKCSAAFVTPWGTTFNGTERANYYLARPFVDQLKNTNDPRCRVISVMYQFPANDLPTIGTEDTVMANQLGMPMGYNDATIVNEPLYPGKSGAAWKYAQVNRRTIGKVDGTYFFVTYAQTQLLLAEAVQRGWATGNVATIYNAAVKGHMDQMAQFDPSATIPAAQQDAYLAANPFNPADALNQINTQYWIASFMNGDEAWANFRRTGLPALTPNPYPGGFPEVQGDFIRRLQHQNSEKTVNVDNYNAAMTRIGGDNMATRVFWDKNP
jgi:hypothetical protein